MTLNLTYEQEQRIQAMIHSGAYESVEDVFEAALTAAEQWAVPAFDGAEGELEALLIQGLNSAEIPEQEYWASMDQVTDAMLADNEAAHRP